MFKFSELLELVVLIIIVLVAFVLCMLLVFTFLECDERCQSEKMTYLYMECVKSNIDKTDCAIMVNGALTDQ